MKSQKTCPVDLKDNEVMVWLETNREVPADLLTEFMNSSIKLILEERLCGPGSGVELVRAGRSGSADFILAVTVAASTAISAAAAIAGVAVALRNRIQDSKGDVPTEAASNIIFSGGVHYHVYTSEDAHMIPRNDMKAVKALEEVGVGDTFLLEHLRTERRPGESQAEFFKRKFGTTLADEEKPDPVSGPVQPETANTLKSPFVGTVYLSPEPGAQNFVMPGDRVSEDDTLMILEAMKVMNPILATEDGTIKAILVENAQPVEYGQPLVAMEPTEREVDYLYFSSERPYTEASYPDGMVTSPMAGTAYLSDYPNENAPKFVQIGQTVKAEDTVIMLESMKLMNPITAGQSGVVNEIFVEHGQAVDFGQPLFLIQ